MCQTLNFWLILLHFPVEVSNITEHHHENDHGRRVRKRPKSVREEESIEEEDFLQWVVVFPVDFLDGLGLRHLCFWEVTISMRQVSNGTDDPHHPKHRPKGKNKQECVHDRKLNQSLEEGLQVLPVIVFRHARSQHQ